MSFKYTYKLKKALKLIIKKIINFALPTKGIYFTFFKYKRNAYFITKQHGLLVAVRAGFMHYSLMKKIH